MTDTQEPLPEKVQQLLDMTDHLDAIRERNGHQDSPEENDHLDEMDVVWYAMTSDEHKILERQLKEKDHADRQ